MKPAAWLMLALALALALAAAGCEQEVERTAQSLQGSWEGGVANAQMTLNLGANGTFTIDVENANMVFVTSVWGKLPTSGLWRLGEDEIVFSDYDNATLDGLEIAKLHADSARFRARNGAEADFTRVATRATPPPPKRQAPSGDEGADPDPDDLGG